MQALAVAETIAFGPFVLDPAARALLVHGAKLALSSRAFDILLLLVSERERVVSKDEIITRVWRGVAVEENNLAVQVSSLRRVLAEHADGQTMIVTVPGQGYRFVGRVEATAEAPPEAEAGPMAKPEAVLGPAPAVIAAPRRPWPRPAMAGIAAICLVVAGLGVRWALLSAAVAPRLSIAVLPFRNLGDDPKQDYLAEAVSDDLTTDLSHLPGSVVIARESSDVYRGRAAPAEQIGRALKARYLLEGSLRSVDGILRINAQLIEASNGAHLWAERFDVARDKLADAQTAIVHHIANALDVRLAAIESDRALHERPNDPDALDLYYRARSIHDRAVSLAEFSEAQKLLERAVALQPNFVDALTELSLVLITKIHDFEDPDDSTDHAEVARLVAQALGLAPHNEDALTAQGLFETIDGHVREGEASLQAAIEADPNNVPARAALGMSEWFLGKPDATIAALTRVFELDPQGPGTRRYMTTLGIAYFMVGKWDNAIEWLLRRLSGDPGISGAGVNRLEWNHLFLMAAYDRAGDRARGRRMYDDYTRQWPHRSVWRLSSYFQKAQLDLPGFAALRAALEDVGMPTYAQPDAQATATSVATAQARGDFDPSPAEIAGSRAIDVVELTGMLRQSTKPVILDVGIGAATLPDAIWIPNADARVGGLDDVLERLVPQARGPIVIVGDGPYGWSGPMATLRVLQTRLRPVLWLRGGEEALAASGIPTANRRIP